MPWTRSIDETIMVVKAQACDGCWAGVWLGWVLIWLVGLVWFLVWVELTRRDGAGEECAARAVQMGPADKS